MAQSKSDVLAPWAQIAMSAGKSDYRGTVASLSSATGEQHLARSIFG